MNEKKFDILYKLGFFDWLSDHKEYKYSEQPEYIQICIIQHFIFEKYELVLTVKNILYKTDFKTYIDAVSEEIFDFFESLLPNEVE